MSNSSCDSDHLHRERGEQGLISSQLQQQLEQIYMLMDMELEHELHLHHNVPPQGCSQRQLSSPFLPFAVSSDVTSSPVLTSSSTTTFCQQPAEASPSPLDTPFSPLPYSYSDTIPDLEEIMSRPRHKDGHAESGTSAFRQYVRHLRPKKKLKQGGCGQRAIKTAMSVLARMHSSRLSQWQRCRSPRRRWRRQCRPTRAKTSSFCTSGRSASAVRRLTTASRLSRMRCPLPAASEIKHPY